MIKAGQIYVVRELLVTRAGATYIKGDELHVIEPTGQDPHREWEKITKHMGLDPKYAINWMVKCKFWQPPDPRSIWATLPGCIVRGLVYLKI